MLEEPNFDPSDLPRCLAKHCIAPRDCTLAASTILYVQQYIVMVNHHASACYSAFKHSKDLPEATVDLTMHHEAHRRLRALAIKPLTKKQGRIPLDPVDLPSYLVEIPEIHFDGSYTAASEEHDEKAGFGVAVALPGGEIRRYHGPVQTDCRSLAFRGATRLSNNVAELYGIIFSLEIAATLPVGKVIIGYDSEYARRTTTGEWRPRMNAKICAYARVALGKLVATHSVEWKHVESHTGHPLNELADQLADLGADRQVRLPNIA